MNFHCGFLKEVEGNDFSNENEIRRMKPLIKVLHGRSAMTKVVEKMDELFRFFTNNDKVLGNNQNVKETFFMNDILSCQTIS